MELVSYHFNHKTSRTVLGYQYLQFGYNNGINFFSLDVATWIFILLKKPQPGNKQHSCMD